jgi:hypothetical protein
LKTLRCQDQDLEQSWGTENTNPEYLSPKSQKILWLIVLNVGGVACLGLPLLGMAISLKNRHWILAALCGFAWFALKRILLAIENRVGVRSSSNPQSQQQGSGITFVAPWLRSREDKNYSDKVPLSDREQ